jgi:hypothetical protein
MALSPDQIKALLAKPEKRGGRGKGGIQVNTSVRDYATWFKLVHKILDSDSKDANPIGCSNDNCIDPRTYQGSQPAPLVAEVNGVFMCRYCFLSGFMSIDPSQLPLVTDSGD